MGRQWRAGGRGPLPTAGTWQHNFSPTATAQNAALRGVGPSRLALKGNLGVLGRRAVVFLSGNLPSPESL